ncbi:MAG: hypothetical protein LBT90_03235 [Holosporaceae bacterium]|jgi:hypothetical protein|nr:hypothetical protein [Holosporaceae bacterium]
MYEMIRQMRQRMAGSKSPWVAFTNAFIDICNVYKEGENLYEILQNGKNHLREIGAGWSVGKKRQANQQYKNTASWLHRSGSPDVFPGIR